MPETPSHADPPVRRKPLPVTITPGMLVVDINDGIPGTIVGITQAYCIYRLPETETLVVAAWRDLALGNVCPADPLLPANVTESDRCNAQATVLRELLALQQFGLSAEQSTVLNELISKLTGEL